MSQEGKFVIGEFTFDNFYEYRAALEDVQKIECINKELDIRDPEVAIRLYNDMKEGRMVFKSPIGAQFVDHVGDIVAQSSSGLLDVRDTVIAAKSQTRNSRIIGTVCVALAVVLFGIFGVMEAKEILHTRRLSKLAQQSASASELAEQQAKLQQEMAAAAEAAGTDNNTVDDSNVSVTPEPTAVVDTTVADPSNMSVMAEYADLYAQNPDLIGWIYIMDTDVNYPVLQTKDDPEYYLRRDFYKASSKAGSIFMDGRCDIINPTTNTILYGHNMKNGTMFGTLKNFLDESFYLSHRTIIFNTIYEKRTYEIEAVGLSEVARQDDYDSYRYYNFISAEDDSDFEEFRDYVTEHSIYNKDVDIDITDKILTLSTCNSYTEDGRLFIVAKCIN